ncbi:MAG: ATPase, central domain protein [Rhodocyclaceae bacterium]|nr:ATPase, central domain protein [Rhodocyclaceae bacterium]
MQSLSTMNAAVLARELDWFALVLEARLTAYFEARDWQLDQLPPPDLARESGPYAGLVREHAMAPEERLVLLLALIPHIRPQALDALFTRNKTFERPFTEFGGWPGKTHGGFLPTCETAVFIAAGADLERRFRMIPLFENDHFFAHRGILRLEHGERAETLFSGALTLSGEYLHLLTSGSRQKPDFSASFPAKLITTPLTWDDLVLAPEVLEEIANIQLWLEKGPALMRDWGLEKAVKPGYRALFYGPPGTGKTLTATLIGANAGVDVYRIDLSMVVSKYIGETEKNLAGVFDQAASKNWVLFFDEADALFGRRTQTSSSNDRHANQEVAYLLQRIEDFPGMVILATNLRANIDEAFARRFQSSIYFPLPDAEQRLQLWRGILDPGQRLAPDVDLEHIAHEYPLAGGAIANVARYAVLRALQRNRDRVAREDLHAGIARERLKEGKAIA